MSIQIKCLCNNEFSVAERFIGQMVRCPSCGKPGRIPKPARQETFDATVPREWCPRCEAVLTPNGRLCRGCSYEVKTGKKYRPQMALIRSASLAAAGVALLVGLWIGSLVYLSNSGEEAEPTQQRTAADTAEEASEAGDERQEARE